ncbi:MAG: neutral zinc metallopeptidase [Geminicoccaceae bacterium]|nr:neutral zinc metallopeptidase [Geminicoccaceae bacterium]
MRWGRMRESSNVEDRRGGGGMMRYPGGGMRVGRVVGGGGIGTIVLVLIALFLGVDPSFILGGGGGYVQPTNVPSAGRQGVPEGDTQAEFASRVLGETEDTWSAVFQDQLGQTYRDPKLVLFDGQVASACGYASSATGPFYCPGDQQVYLDTSFFDELSQRFGAPGDFAEAYVIAHEVGHHVQTLLGISSQVSDLRRQSSEADANRLSVMTELQADCFAGVWAKNADETRQVLEQGDVEEGLNAAAAIGDDRLQRQSRGYVTPDSFTHGTSEQRVRWFKTGMQSGQVDSCDTFNAGQL